MDTNSGYVHVPGDTALALVLLLLDVLRGLCAFEMLYRLVGAGTGTPTPVPPTGSPAPAGEPDDPGSGNRPSMPTPGQEEEGPAIAPGETLVSGRSVALALFAAATVALLIQHLALGNIPRVNDEIIQDWQARTLAQGRLHGVPTPHGESFAIRGLDYNQTWLYSSYQPALALIWSLVQPLGRIDLVNPLLALLAGFLWYRLVRLTHGAATAGPAALLLGVSPFFVLMAAGRMNHPLSLVLFLAVLHGLLRLDDPRWVRGAALSGLALGVMLMTRRIDALAAGGALGLFLLAVAPVPWRRRLGFGVIVLLLAAGVFRVQSLFAKACAGDALQMVRWAQGMAGLWWDIPPGTLLGNTFDNLTGFAVFAFGGLLAGFGGLAFLTPRRDSPEGLLQTFLVLHAGLLLVGYGIYDYQDFCYGPRFHFTLLPLATLGGALLLTRLGSLVPPQERRRFLGGIAAVGLLVIGLQIWSVLNRTWWHIDPGLETFLAGQAPRPALVFLGSPTRIRLEAGRRLVRAGISPNELPELLALDSLDFHGLLRALELPGSGAARLPAEAIGAALRPPAAPSPGRWGAVMGLLEPRFLMTRFRQQARDLTPEQLTINELETIRLNGPDPLSQDLVLARDLGDRRNGALIADLPGHRPMLLWRTPAGFTLEPYRPAGVEDLGNRPFD